MNRQDAKAPRRFGDREGSSDGPIRSSTFLAPWRFTVSPRTADSANFKCDCPARTRNPARDTRTAFPLAMLARGMRARFVIGPATSQQDAPEDRRGLRQRRRGVRIHDLILRCTTRLPRDGGLSRCAATTPHRPAQWTRPRVSGHKAWNLRKALRESERQREGTR